MASTSNPRMIPRRLMLSLVALCALGGCQRDRAEEREEPLVVFAAASLREAFGALGEAFERARPGVSLTFNFAGTQELRTQLEHGADVDVFASADQRHMAALRAAGRVEEEAIFARNEPVVVVSREAADRLRRFEQLPEAARLVVGAPAVPIGRYTAQLLERADARLGAGFRARVEAKVASRELSVRQVLAKVSLGEAEAGVVYRTDARSAGDALHVVPIPADINVRADYPIAVVHGAKHPELARAWVAFVLSPEGQHILAEAGFAPGEGSAR